MIRSRRGFELMQRRAGFQTAGSCVRSVCNAGARERLSARRAPVPVASSARRKAM